MPQLDVVQLARDDGSWRGEIDVAAFERLGNVLFGVAGSRNASSPRVAAALDFSLDDEGRPRVTGTCKVVAPIRCSRCAETLDIEVESRLDLRVVATDAEAEALMPAFDTVVSEDDRLSLTALVEDDILLSIPERCCEDVGECAHANEAEVAAEAARSSSKPLEGLRALVEGRRPV